MSVMDSAKRKARCARGSGAAVGRVCSLTGKGMREVGSEGNRGTVRNACIDLLGVIHF
jgi:hypothetical protein